MIINHNITALNTHNKLSSASAAQSKSMEKLASGLRINRAGDDAAGLAISEKMRAQVRGLDQASRNAQDGISLIQTAEGALNETHDILQRMRELSNQSANGTATDSDRSAMQDELNQLTSEINRVGNTTEFNTQKLLNGGISSKDGVKFTQATNATITLGTVAIGATAAGTSIKVDGQTFDVSGVDVAGATDADALAAAAALGAKTSGGTKLSDLVDIKTDGSGKLILTSKSSGPDSKIEFSAAASAPIGLGAATAAVKGSPSTTERVGLDATAALSASSKTITSTDSLKITVGNESAVEVKLNSGDVSKVYDTANADTNVAKSEMDKLVKDLNAALQDSGLSDKVTASLDKDNKLQFISETGKDISIANGSGTPIASLGGGFAAVKNVQQVVGSTAQGTGFSTKFQIGANTGQSMSLAVSDMRAAAIKITGNAGQAGFTKANAVTNGTNDVKSEAALNISNKEDAAKSIAVIDKAISTVSTERGKLGAVQNRLEHTINNLKTSSENLTAAESRIRDVDMAKEMMNQTKNSILAQAAQAMLAQSNQAPQGVLQLLR